MTPLTDKSYQRRPAWEGLLFAVLAIAIGAASGLLVVAIDSTLKVVLLVVGLALAWATLTRVELGLMTLIFITYTRLSDVLITYYGAPSVAQPFALLLLLLICIRWAFYGETPRLALQVMLPLLLYVGITFASLLFAVDVDATREAWIDLVKDLVLAVEVIVLLRSGSQLRLVIWTLLGSGLFLGTISTYQYLTGTFGNHYWGFGQAAMQNIVGATHDYRIAGPIGDPNFYAQIMVVLVPLALDRLHHERGLLLRGLAAWALMVSVLTIFFTFSRGSFLALLVVAGLFFLRRPPHPLALLVALILAVPLFRVLPETYVARISTMPGSLLSLGDKAQSELSLRGRTSEILVGWQMFADHPFLGVGFNNYPTHYQRYSEQAGLDMRSEARSAHSLYIQILAETGLVGMAAFMLLLWSVFAACYRARTLLEAGGLHDLAAGVYALSVGIAGYLAAALFLHGAYPRYFWLLVGIALALPALARSAVEREGSRP